jgi:hypothetical protein
VTSCHVLSLIGLRILPSTWMQLNSLLGDDIARVMCICFLCQMQPDISEVGHVSDRSYATAGINTLWVVSKCNSEKILLLLKWRLSTRLHDFIRLVEPPTIMPTCGLESNVFRSNMWQWVWFVECTKSSVHYTKNWAEMPCSSSGLKLEVKWMCVVCIMSAIMPLVLGSGSNKISIAHEHCL